MEEHYNDILAGKVTPIRSEISAIKSQTGIKNDKIYIDSVRYSDQKEVFAMEKNTYTKNEIDLKLEIIEQKIESKVNELSTKIDNLPTIFENMLLKEREYQNEKRKGQTRWIIGTVITITSIIIPILVNSFSK